LVVFAAFLPAFPCPLAWGQSPPAEIVIEHATVIDGTGAPARRDVTIAIGGGRILSMDRSVANGVKPPPGVRVIDASGEFLIPGLWDMHVHLDAQGSELRALVANGITGIREMYSAIPIATLGAWRARPENPRIAAAGFLDGPLMLTSGPARPDAYAVGNAEEARQAVELLQARGADFLKVYNGLPREAYFEIAQRSKSLGISFAGHVPEAVSPAEASEAGQRSQEHLINILLACSSREEELRAQRISTMNDPGISPVERALLLGFPDPQDLFDSYDDTKAAALFKTFVKNETWQTPTLALLQSFLADRERARRLLYMQDLSPQVFGGWMARISALLDRYKKLVRDMHRAGVDFLAGTDTGPNNPVPVGIGLHDELELLVESGFTPMEALQTATRNPARYFGRLQEMGTIETGKLADLVLLSASPLDDIRNTRKIALVILRGRIAQ
jgi:cytosine/adenosine deaminase-related metal-dependent hydrolase